MSPRRRPLDETLLSFAGIDAAALAGIDPDELDSRLQLALLVWNAVLLADEEAAEARGRGEDSEAAFEAVLTGLIDDIRTSLGPSQRGPDRASGAAPDIDDEDGGDREGDEVDTIETLVRYLVVRKLEEHLGDTRPIAEAYIERDDAGRLRVVVTGL